MLAARLAAKDPVHMRAAHVVGACVLVPGDHRGAAIRLQARRKLVPVLFARGRRVLKVAVPLPRNVVVQARALAHVRLIKCAVVICCT